MKKENNKKLKKEERQPTPVYLFIRNMQDLKDSELKKVEDCQEKNFINLKKATWCKIVPRRSNLKPIKGRSRCTDYKLKISLQALYRFD